MTQYKAAMVISEYSQATGEYTSKHLEEFTVNSDEIHRGEDIALVSGVGKVLANITGTYLVQVNTSDNTAVMEITVGAQTINWKNGISIQVTGDSVLIDADKNCNITYTAIKLQ